MNVICDRALLGAYSRESRTVDKQLVRKAASEVSGQKVQPRFLRWLVPLLGVASLVLAVSVLWSSFDSEEDPADTTTIPLMVDEAQLAAESDAEATLGELTAARTNAPPAEQVDIEELFTGYDEAIGYTTLLGLWGVEYDPAAGSACSQAEAAELRCYFQRGSWGNLRQLDRPVVLTLTGPQGESFDVALTGLDDTSAQLAVADGYVTVGVDDLTDYWFGQFLLLWRPANGNDQPIGPGMQNENVRWLRQSLATIDTEYNPASGSSDVFDAELEQRLIAFQRQHRLEADGLAGQKTIIIINSLLAPEGTPRLTSNN